MPLFGMLFIISRSQKRDALCTLHVRGTGGMEPAVKAGMSPFSKPAQRSHRKVAAVFLAQPFPHLMTPKLICSWWQNLHSQCQAAGQGTWLRLSLGPEWLLAVSAPHSLTA